MLIDEDGTLQRADTLTRVRDAKQYRVKERRPEEFGWTRYILEFVA